MIKKTEIEKLKVLGEQWTVEVDYYENGSYKITVYNEDDQRIIDSKESFEVKIIAKNLTDIASLLETAEELEDN